MQVHVGLICLHSTSPPTYVFTPSVHKCVCVCVWVTNCSKEQESITDRGVTIASLRLNQLEEFFREDPRVSLQIPVLVPALLPDPPHQAVLQRNIKTGIKTHARSQGKKPTHNSQAFSVRASFGLFQVGRTVIAQKHEFQIYICNRFNLIHLNYFELFIIWSLFS